MQKWLDNNDDLIYSRNNEDKSIERFIKSLNRKIYIRLEMYRRLANDQKCCVDYLNKLVDQYRNAYNCSVDKKPVDVDYSALTG